MATTVVYDERLGGRMVAAPRRLGSVFAPPRISYLLYMPLLMTAAALVCWIIPTDLMLAVGSLVLGGVGCYLFFDLMVRWAPLRVSTLFATTLALGYGVGSANSWFTLPRGGVALGDFLHHDPAFLTHTMGSTLFAMAVLLGVGEAAEKPLFGEEFELLFPTQAIVFISVGVLLLLVAYATGALNYMGGFHSDTGQVGLLSSFSVWLIGTLFAITLVAALNAKTKGMRLYLMLLTGLQFILQIPIGRRSLIYTMILGILSLRLGPHRFNWSWLKRIAFGLILTGMLYLATVAFYYMRLAGFSKTNLTIIDRVSLAWEYFETKDYREVSQAFSQNVQQRTFILGFLGDLEHYSSIYTPGYGRDMWGQLLAAVPSALYPSKDRNFSEEGLSNDLFGSTYWDEANSVLTAGALDFGLLGMVAYPLIISFMVRGFFEFVGQTLPTFVATFIIIAGIGRLLEPENNVTDYFILMRNGLLFGAGVWFFIALPAFRLRSEH